VKRFDLRQRGRGRKRVNTLDLSKDVGVGEGIVVLQRNRISSDPRGTTGNERVFDDSLWFSPPQQ